MTATLFSAIDSLFPLARLIPLKANPFTFAIMVGTGIQNNKHCGSIAVIYILMPRRTKIVRAVGFLAFSASRMGVV